MHGFDYSVPHFITCVQGTCIVVTPQIIADVLRVPRVEFPNYPSHERLKTVSKDKLKSAFREHFLSGLSISSLTVRAFQKALSF